MRRTLCRLLTAAALAASPATAPAAAPAPARAKDATPLAAARKALDEVGDFTYQNRSLTEVVADLKARAELSVTLDPMLEFDPSQSPVSVNLKGVKLKEALRQALAPLNLHCGLTRDGLFISTEEGLTNRQLRQRVSVDCDGTPFAAAAKQLAADTGANIVIDPRLKQKADAAFTLKLDDVPLETVVRLMAEVADLGTVRMSNVLFVTTPDRAAKLRPSADGPTRPSGTAAPAPVGPDQPAPFPVPGAPGIGVAVPGGVVPAAAVEKNPDPPRGKKPGPPPAVGLAPPPSGEPGLLPPPPPASLPPVPPGATPPPPPGQ